MDNDPMRLQRFLARAGVASRRASETIIRDGRVAVNGLITTDPATKVSPEHDEVSLDGTALVLPERDVVIMLNKPQGYTTTMSDPHAKHTVSELIPSDIHPSLYPLGRLDTDTEGLLLFATDGRLGHALLHPSHHVNKTYVAKISGRLSEGDRAALERGIELDDGMTAPASVNVLDDDAAADTSTVQITIHEGRKRQVRRMFAAVDHPVMELERTSFGPLSLGDLQRGTWRYLTDDEYAKLKDVAGI